MDGDEKLLSNYDVHKLLVEKQGKTQVSDATAFQDLFTVEFELLNYFKERTPVSMIKNPSSFLNELNNKYPGLMPAEKLMICMTFLSNH